MVRTVQCARNLWRIYFNTNQSKVDFITHGLNLDNKHIRAYNSNPFATGAIRSGVRSEDIDKVCVIRVLIKELYESVSNEQVEHMMKNIFGIKLTSEVQYAYY